jgi:hypothetical protein
MKRLAGTPNPRSWKETKLTTYPGGGDGVTPLAGGIHSGCLSSERGRSKPSATRSSRSPTVTVEKGHGSRGEMMVTRSAITKQKRWRRKRLGGRFPSLWINLSGCENLRRRREAEQRTVARPSPGYIKTPARLVQCTAPNPPRDSKTQSETVVPRTARTRNGRPTNHSPHRINSTVGQAAPRAGEASDASPSP